MDNGIGEEACWDGKEDRRKRPYLCQRVEQLREDMHECKSEIDAEIASINGTVGKLSHEVAGLRGDVHGLRSDVHNMAGSVKSMENSLSTIALTMTKLSDFPETWQNITGFLKVMRWMRDNIVIVGILFAVFAYVTWMGGKAIGLIPV